MAHHHQTNSRFTESYEFYSGEFARLTGSLDSAAENEILNALERLHVIPRILQEGILLTGGAVAIMLQAAVPGVATAAKADSHGSLAEHLYQRLHVTTVYIFGLTFGTREQRKRLLDRIYSSPPQQQRQQSFSEKAEDATVEHSSATSDQSDASNDLKWRLWVASTLYATGTSIYQRIYGKLSLKEAQRAYAEFSVLVKAILNIPKDVWPATRNAFWATWDENVSNLDVDARARLVPGEIKSFRHLPGWLKISRPFMKNITPEMLPPHVREQYGYKSSSFTRFKYQLYMGTARAIYPALPSTIRYIPKKRAMRKIEKILQRN